MKIKRGRKTMSVGVRKTSKNEREIFVTGISQGMIKKNNLGWVADYVPFNTQKEAISWLLRDKF